MLRLILFFIESTRSLGVSQGCSPGLAEKGYSWADSLVFNWGVNLSFFLALGVITDLGGTGGFLAGLDGPPTPAFCFIPWAVLTSCVNQACTGPASKSSSPGEVAGVPVPPTPLTGAPKGWRTFLVQCPN